MIDFIEMIITYLKAHWQFFAAFAGVIVSLLGVYLTEKEVHRNVAKVKLGISRAVLQLGTGQIVHLVNCRISNHGRRPITVNHVYFETRNGLGLHFPFPQAFLQNSNGLPKRIEENESHDVGIYKDAIVEAIHREQTGLVALCFTDALGKDYRLKLKKKYWRDLTNP